MFFEMLLASFFYIAYYCISYLGPFSSCFKDNMEFCYGKKKKWKKRRKQTSFWKWFLFIDIKQEAVLWHYILFWVNLVSSTIALLLLNVYIAYNHDVVIRFCFAIFALIAFLTTTIIAFVRWRLYAGNKVRKRK